MDVQKYWQDVLKQDRNALRGYFHKKALIYWHNTNEKFTVEEFIAANCDYPGEWDGRIERIEASGNIIITVARVWTKDRRCSFHAVSFIEIENGKISSINEYWGDDGTAPQWRLDKQIGSPIQEKDAAVLDG